MHPFARLLLVLAVASRAAVAQDAAVVELFELKPYPVSGGSPAEVRQSIFAARPAYGGRRFDALTLWHISYSYKHVVEDGWCSAGDVKVDLRITVHMPALSGVSETTRAAFGAYLTALRAHEDHHVLIDRAIADEVAAVIRRVPARSSCEALGDEIRRAATRAMEQGRRRNDAYDAETQHGAAEGAIYPG